ncbi:HDL245Cp [Eremothecium sinecaudum]|uniref:HDL245Cp n=1 Tax=Eremothecium sinecaudum TaxID=45286 RepID=A0A0X8HS89_9SACH|nr:HDL245Cp [Eremothecium sinecaudum]AMD20499.1 HDL245Cp [Eremothecium sinecaudum]
MFNSLLLPRLAFQARSTTFLSVSNICLRSGISTRKYSTLKPNDLNPKKPKFTASAWTIPNALTISRIATAPLVGYCIITNSIVPAFCLFTYSCVTDFLDGYIARKYNIRSMAGTILDPIADKFLMIVSTVALTFPPGPQLIPLWIASLILGRDILLGLSAIYFRYASMIYAYSKVSWGSFWNIISYPSAEVRPTMISKVNTLLQMVYLGWAVVLLMIGTEDKDKDTKEPPANGWLYKGFTYLGYLVGTTTVLSGASYVFNKNTVKYFKRNQ